MSGTLGTKGHDIDKKLMPGPAPPLRASPPKPGSFLHLPRWLTNRSLERTKAPETEAGTETSAPHGRPIRLLLSTQKRKNHALFIFLLLPLLCKHTIFLEFWCHRSWLKNEILFLSLKSKGVCAGKGLGEEKGNHRSAVLEGLSMGGCLCLYR